MSPTVCADFIAQKQGLTMENEKQNNSSQKGQQAKEPVVGTKPIGLQGGQTGGQTDGPTGSSVPDSRANPDENKKA